MTLLRDIYQPDGDSYNTPGISDIPRPVPTISILHPGFQSSNRIITLPALDRLPNSNPPVFGIHHGTLAAICFIITGNRPGFLSAMPQLPEDEDERVVKARPLNEPTYESVLTEPFYYYYIYGLKPSERYNVLSSFSGWMFPSCERLSQLESWKSWVQAFGERPGIAGGPVAPIQMSIAPPPNFLDFVRGRDKTCVVTGAAEACGCTVAQLIPVTEEHWFKHCYMETFGNCYRRRPGENHTVVPSNLCVLRGDLAAMLDALCIVFTPKEGKPVVHFLDSQPACRHFHNALVHSDTYLSEEYAFSRLALAVLPKTKEFCDAHKDEFCIDTTWDKILAAQHTNELSLVKYEKSWKKEKVDENRELGEDLARAIRKYLPMYRNLTIGDFVDNRGPTCPEELEKSVALSHSPPDTYSDWYPGHRRVERLKRKYAKEHPQVCATSGGTGGYPEGYGELELKRSKGSDGSVTVRGGR